jgi:hypothetical protein
MAKAISQHSVYAKLCSSTQISIILYIFIYIIGNVKI